MVSREILPSLDDENELDVAGPVLRHGTDVDVAKKAER
jgi:hypothetical protein